jgi:hypothetical protein
MVLSGKISLPQANHRVRTTDNTAEAPMVDAATLSGDDYRALLKQAE